MILNKNIFRAYDIRWIYKQDFDLESSEKIWKAYWTQVIRTSKNKKFKVVIWRDWRTHSEEVQNAFIKWVLSTWIDVVNIWLSPSPLLYFSICYWKFDGWVNITASHNPKEYNWFKLQRDWAESIFWDEIQEIYKLIEKNDFEKWKWKEEFWTFFPEYINKLKEIEKENLNTEDLKIKKKIVVDWWNWVAGPFATNLFRYLWYEVVELFCNIDWEFPNHPADPEDETTLKDLIEKVKEEKADIWIAFDWDWDRLWVVDENWKTYNADKLLILFSRDLLKRKKWETVVYELNITSLLKEEVEKLWWKAVMCKTGHSFVEHAMKENKALIWWENSWHLFFAENYYWFDDALLATVMVWKIIFKKDKTSLKKEFESLPKTFEFAKKFETTDDKKFEIVEKIAKELEKKYEVNRLDWARVEFENFWWLVLRASNTSPKFQLRIETRTKKQMDEIKKEILAIVEKCK